MTTATPLSRPPARFRRIVAGLRQSPRGIKFVAALLLALGIGAGAYFLFHHLPKQRKQQEISGLWAKFDEAAKSGADAEQREALEAILRANPDDALAASRLDSLRTGSADAEDPAMALLTLPPHLIAGRWPEAEREANKRLAHQPKDWLARCTTAKAAVLRGDRAAAVRELDALPDPADGVARITPASLLFALDLFRDLDRDSAGLRRFIREVIVDTARSSAAESFPAPVKIQLVECYLEGFEPKAERQPSGLNLGVLAVGRLADLALDDPAVAADSLRKLGFACNRLQPAFARLHREGQITADQFPTIRREHEARTVRAWQTLLDRDPKSAPAYHGLAVAALRNGDATRAGEIVTKGLAACGDNPQLLALLALMLRADDRALPALGRLWEAAEKDPEDLSLWVLTAEAAEAAGRRDVALEACATARALDPKNVWILRTEARILIEAGGPYAHTGLQLLAALGDRLPGDPAAARLYVRGLTEAGLHALVEGFLKKVEAESLKRGSPAAIGQALRGIADGRTPPALLELASATAKSMLDRFPNDLELMTAEALALSRSAEDGEPRWTIPKTGAALRSFERLRDRAPDDVEIAAVLAWIRLKGMADAVRAMRDAAPLIAAAEDGSPLTARQGQVLGAVHLADGKLDDAIRVLEKARRLAKNSAGIHAHLAVAYHRQGRKAESRAALEAARSLPRSPQEAADTAEAAALLQREKS